MAKTELNPLWSLFNSLEKHPTLSMTCWSIDHTCLKVSEDHNIDEIFIFILPRYCIWGFMLSIAFWDYLYHVHNTWGVCEDILILKNQHFHRYHFFCNSWTTYMSSVYFFSVGHPDYPNKRCIVIICDQSDYNLIGVYMKLKHNWPCTVKVTTWDGYTHLHCSSNPNAFDENFLLS